MQITRMQKILRLNLDISVYTIGALCEFVSACLMSFSEYFHIEKKNISSFSNFNFYKLEDVDHLVR